MNSRRQSRKAPMSRGSPKGLGLLKLVDEDGTPLVGQYENPLLDVYAQESRFPSQPPLKIRRRKLQRSEQLAHKKAHAGGPESSASPERASRRSSTGSNKSVHFEDAESATPVTVRESEDSEDDDDEEFEPDNIAESDKENAEPRANDTESTSRCSDSSKSSSSTSVAKKMDLSNSGREGDNDSDSDNESEETESDSDREEVSEETSSSASSSSSDSSSDSEPEQLPSHALGPEADSSETSSSGSSSSRSESESESKTVETEAEARKEALRKQLARNNIVLKAQGAAADSVLSASTPQAVPPGQGKSKTWKRNRRRRETLRLQSLKQQGILPATATIEDLRKLNEDNTQSSRAPVPENTPGDEAEERQNAPDTDLELALNAKRQALLVSVATSGVDCSPTVYQREQEYDSSANDAIEGKETEPDVVDADNIMKFSEGIISAEVQVRENVPQKPSSDSVTRLKETTYAPPEPKRVTASSPIDSTAPALSEMPQQLLAVEPEKLPVKASTETSTPPLSEALKATPKETSEEIQGNNSPSSSQHRRSRLDLSGTKRMLFGSLGLRTPKTKEDESKMRDKLMKDVRPVNKSQNNRAAEIVDVVAAAAGDDSWKEKIDLRAVECCHEGIDLSTPPFPFVQRWDPQQQGGYKNGKAKKRKGKKRKRNNDNFYEESSHRNSHSKAARHHEYDSPAHELQYAEHIDKEYVKAGLQEHEQEQMQVDRQDSLAASEQLLRETEEVSSVTLQETADLPAVPQDPTSCPALTRDTATAGTVIAFKQFHMGLETNWQPIVTAYRTAIVDGVEEDGSLYMTPAKRDRPTKEIYYDEQTGDRIYRKFEMPGYDEEEDANDSKIELKFDELISPILIRAAEDKQEVLLEQPESPAKGQDLSAFHFDPKDSAIDDSFRTATGQLGLDGVVEEPVEEQAVTPGEETRAEISELIRHAGWRSSLGSEVNGTIKAPLEDQFLENREEGQESSPEHVPSPKFSGFTSSPPFSSVQVQSSPILAEARATKDLHASGTEIAESVPYQAHHDYVSPTGSAVEYPELPQMGEDSDMFLQGAPQVDDDSDFFPQEAQEQSLLHEQDHSTLSQDLTLNGMDHSPAQSTRSHNLPSQEHSSPIFKAPHAIDSDDDSLPPLFSQAWDRRMSREASIKPETFSSQESVIDSISPPARRSSKPNGKRISSQKDIKRPSWKPEENDLIESDGETTPKASQRFSQLPSQVVASQVIDLTQCSDPVAPVGSPSIGRDNHEDSHVLPEGSGWVKKSRTSYSSSAPTKANTGRRKTKST